MGFLTSYKAVFDAVQKALVYVPAVPEVPAHDDVPEVPAVPASGVASIKTVVLGEQFTMGDLPKAIINAEDAPITQENSQQLSVKVNFSVILVIQEYTPRDRFKDIIPVMADAWDAIMADRTLGGACFDLTPLGFFPGEIHFKEEQTDKTLYGGQVSFCAEILYEA